MSVSGAGSASASVTFRSAGRSFLNFLLQLSYKDRPEEREKGRLPAQPSDAQPRKPDTIR